MTRNETLYEQAVRLMPGTHSNLRVPLADRPLFFTRGLGAHLWDADGREYIEYWNGAGPGILGYGNEEYVAAVCEQLRNLQYLFGVGQIPLEIELAEKIVRHVPCAEKVRFCISGSEAVQLAIRLARAYTGRPFFIRFEGHYHGWLDNVLGGGVSEDPASDPFPVDYEKDFYRTEGRAPHAFKDGFLLPWNDADVLEQVLERHGERVAMVHMEPILVNGGCCFPKPGYMEKVRSLCSRYGVLLSFDEVITGFRVGLGGAQGALRVTPDLATFGKAMGGGAPIAAVAGKAEILDQLLARKVIGAGTFNGNPVGTAAALATIRILERDDGAFYREIDRRQERLRDGLLEIGRRRGIANMVQGPRGAFCHAFSDREVFHTRREVRQFADMERQRSFFGAMADEGVLFMGDGRWYISGGLTDEDVERTLEAAERVFARL